MPQSNPPSLFADILSFWKTKTQLPEFTTKKGELKAGINFSTRTKPLPPLASISVGEDLKKNGNKPIELSATPLAFAGADAKLETKTDKSGVLNKIDAGYTFGAFTGIMGRFEFDVPGLKINVDKPMLFGKYASANFGFQKHDDDTTKLEVGGQAAAFLGGGLNVGIEFNPNEIEKDLNKNRNLTEYLQAGLALSVQLLGIETLVNNSWQLSPTSDPLPLYTPPTPTTTLNPTPTTTLNPTSSTTTQKVDNTPTKIKKYPQFSDDEKKEIFNYIDQAAQLGLKQKINEGDEPKYFDHLMDKIDDKKAQKIKNAYNNIFKRASIQLLNINESNDLPRDQKIKLFDFFEKEKKFNFMVENSEDKINRLNFIIKSIIFNKNKVINSINKIIEDKKKEREEERGEAIEEGEEGEEKQQNANEPLLNPKHPSKNVPSSFMGKIYTALSSTFINFKKTIKKLKPPSPTIIVRGYDIISKFFSRNQKF